MGNTTILQLIQTLNNYNRTHIGCSESANRTNKETAQDIIRQSDLDEETKNTVILAIGKASNPSGWYYVSNGISGGLTALETALVEFEAKDVQTTETPALTPTALNLRNLQNLVSDGAIFHVSFIKRTTGERRLMQCRTGVKKHLKGGKKSFSDKAKNLLTVFDMKAKGYRSIPVEAIQALTINGQSFNFQMGV